MSAFAQIEEKVRELVVAGLTALVKRVEDLEQSCADGGAVDDALVEINKRLDKLEAANKTAPRSAPAARPRTGKTSE